MFISFHKVAFIFFTTISISAKSKEVPNLIVHNNGPAVLGGSITFYATLKNYSLESKLSYKFSDGIQEIIISVDNASASWSPSFTVNLYKPYVYNMTVSVSKHEKSKPLAHNYTTFELRDYLIYKVISSQGEKVDVDEVAVGENVSLSIEMYDPNRYLAGAEINYMWSIDFERQPPMENITYLYTSAGKSNIVTAVVAELPNNVILYGYCEKHLAAKVPVKNVNISGNPFIHHGEMLFLNISCNGSPPFIYCWTPMEKNESTLNFTCQKIVSNTCNFIVRHYFKNYGSYSVGIFVSNDVRSVKRLIEVVVYNVSKTPQLSTVIIPIVCSILTLIIIAGGVTYCLQQRKQMPIEVANFDFQEHSESYVGETFFEKLYDSFICRTFSSNRNGGGGDADELFYEDEEPLLGHSRPVKRQSF